MTADLSRPDSRHHPERSAGQASQQPAPHGAYYGSSAYEARARFRKAIVQGLVWRVKTTHRPRIEIAPALLDSEMTIGELSAFIGVSERTVWRRRGDRRAAAATGVPRGTHGAHRPNPDSP